MSLNAGKPQVAICFRRLGPYHHARLHAAVAECGLVAIEFSSASDAGHPWVEMAGERVVEKITLFDGVDADTRSGREIKQRVFAALDRLDPAVVVAPGWSDRGALSALQWCLKARRPAVLMAESTARDRPRGRIQEAIKRRIVRLYSAALVGGSRTRDYVSSLGLPRELVFQGYDAVDNAHFAGGAVKVRREAENWRTRLQLTRSFFLACSRFIPEKNLLALLNAYARYRYRAGSDCWQLVLLGDGELRASVLQRVAELDLSMEVTLPGFKQYDELPIYYGLAGAFVHASTSEPWGLVVNEAMASGLPVLVSACCGCAPDLVRNGINGYTFEPHDVDQLADLMLRIASHGCDRDAMGRASQEIIKDWDLRRFADGLTLALKAAGTREPRSVGLSDRLLLEGLVRR